MIRILTGLALLIAAGTSGSFADSANGPDDMIASCSAYAVSSLGVSEQNVDVAPDGIAGPGFSKFAVFVKGDQTTRRYSCVVDDETGAVAKFG
jgi:hypothetical protein